MAQAAYPRASQSGFGGPPPPGNYPPASQSGYGGRPSGNRPPASQSGIGGLQPPSNYASQKAPPPGGSRKRFIVACDGTWLNEVRMHPRGQVTQPSNVIRICWAMKDTSRDGIPQIVYYQAGVGSTGDVFTRTLGGATGAGLGENVREAYNFLAVNYTQGDEIYLIGFSRGAFTARSVAGLIGSIGLLTRAGLPTFSDVFKDYENRRNPNYRPALPNVPFRDKPSMSDPRYSQELRRLDLTRLNIPIKVLGVWETVGSLGIPRIRFLEQLGLQSQRMKEYAFYDTSLFDCIENAFQALALDERRAPFAPALWYKPRGSTTNLKQVWFPGVHTNVGGGYDDQELANITLAWMISQLEPFIDFNSDYILRQYEMNRQYYKQSDQRVRPWSFGEIYNSVTGLYALAGTQTRTPGNYYKVDPDTGVATSKLLRNTNEYIHASVRARVGLRGPGVQDTGVYECRALEGWDFTFESSENPDIKEPVVLWKARSSATRRSGQKVIPESVLKDTERTLLAKSSEVYDFILKPPPPRRSKPKR